MRVLAVTSSVISLLLGAGCAVPAPDGELRARVEGASLPGVEKDACQWGFSDFDSEPEEWYGCWGEVPWKLKKTSRTVKRQLVALGYKVKTKRGPHAFYFTAVRGASTLCVDVLGPRYTLARNTYPGQVELRPRHSFVDVWAVNPRPSQSRCPFLPQD